MPNQSIAEKKISSTQFSLFFIPTNIYIFTEEIKVFFLVLRIKSTKYIDILLNEVSIR